MAHRPASLWSGYCSCSISSNVKAVSCAGTERLGEKYLKVFGRGRWKIFFLILAVSLRLCSETKRNEGEKRVSLLCPLPVHHHADALPPTPIKRLYLKSGCPDCPLPPHLDCSSQAQGMSGCIRTQRTALAFQRRVRVSRAASSRRNYPGP